MAINGTFWTFIGERCSSVLSDPSWMRTYPLPDILFVAQQLIRGNNPQSALGESQREHHLNTICGNAHSVGLPGVQRPEPIMAR